MTGVSSAVSGSGGAEALAARLQEKIARRECRVGVIGLGYVGLPLAMVLTESGLDVLGFDIDEGKLSRLSERSSYVGAVSDGRLSAALESGRFQASSDEAALADLDAVLICVPTPLGPEQQPDLRAVTATCAMLGRVLRPGMLVVLESTTYPGCTDELVRPLLEESGLVCGRDFFLAFSPEREDPGNPRFHTANIPKVVGGCDDRAGRLAAELYRCVAPEVVEVSSARVAEASKLTENIFRAVNIALVNELKVVFHAMDIDVREVLDAAETKPFGFMRFDPGPGWGGHCIPIDPFYLSWQARRHGVDSDFIELAGRVNTRMPGWVLDRLEEGLRAHDRELAGSRVLVLGLAYKRDVADPRESPAFELLEQLRSRGAEVEYHDPLIAEAPIMRTWPDLPPLRSVPLEEGLDGFDAAIVATDHSGVDYERIRRQVPLMLDTRGVFRRGTLKVISA